MGGIAEYQTEIYPIKDQYLSCQMPNGYFCGNCVIYTTGIIKITYAVYCDGTYLTNNTEAWVNISGVIKLL